MRVTAVSYYSLHQSVTAIGFAQTPVLFADMYVALCCTYYSRTTGLTVAACYAYPDKAKLLNYIVSNVNTWILYGVHLQ